MKKGLINFSTNHPVWIIMIIIGFTALFGWQLADIRIDTDPENMLPTDEPVRIFNHEFKEQFEISDFLAVGIVNEEGVFNAEQLSRVYHITEAIMEIDGIVAEDVMAPSQVNDIYYEGDIMVIDTLMRRPPQSEAEAQQVFRRILANPILKGKLASEDGKAMALFIPIESKHESHRIAAEITAITDSLGGDETYFIAGLPIAEDSFGREMFGQMIFSAPVAGLIIFILLFVFFRNIRIILPPMIVAMTSIIWTMGALVWAGFSVHIMSSMIPIFLFPIAVLNSIHIISEFHDNFKKHGDRRKTIEHTINELFTPMLFTSATTVVGFLSLMTNNIPPVQVFGGFVAFGVGVSWLMSITLNPAMAMLLPESALKNFGTSGEDTGILARIVKAIGRFSARRYMLILPATAVIIAISIFGLMKIEVNDNPVKWFKSDHPLRVADNALNSHLAGTYMNYLIFQTDEEDAMLDPAMLAYIESVQNHIAKSNIVGSTSGITDFLKKLRLEIAGHGDSLYGLPLSSMEAAQYLLIYDKQNEINKLVNEDYSHANLWVQMTAGDNQEVSGVVNSANKFIEENPAPYELTTRWAGLPYVNIVWQDKMVSGMRISLLASFGIVFLMMAFLFRSALWGLLSMLPLTITIMAIYASIGYFGKPYDMPIAILSSLTLGLSIDFAIHFIQRARATHRRTGNFAETYKQIFAGPGRAISRNVLVIAIGFVPMFFSNLVPYITVGSFFFAIMTVSGGVTLILLPALVTVLKSRLFPELKKNN